jgi:hypothetical protein
MIEHVRYTVPVENCWVESVNGVRQQDQRRDWVAPWAR